MAAKVILLDGSRRAVIREDGEASGAITPGHLIEIGGANDLQVHGTAADDGDVVPWFALPPEGVEADGLDIDEPYAAGDTVKYARPAGGDRVNALLADGEDASTDGTFLESAGDGTLQVQTTGTAVAVVPPGQGLNNSAGGAAARIVVEVL